MNINNQEIFKRMNMYSSLHNLNVSLKQDAELADYIKNHLHTMNYYEKINILKKILTENKINKELLKYELHNYIPDQKITNFKEMINNTKKILSRYHRLAGGRLLEDERWILHQKGSIKYDLKINEAIFENSIADENRDCIKTHNFIKTITNLLEKTSDKFKIRSKCIADPTESIHWIIIKISASKKGKNKKNNK